MNIGQKAIIYLRKINQYKEIVADSFNLGCPAKAIFNFINNRCSSECGTMNVIMTVVQIGLIGFVDTKIWQRHKKLTKDEEK